MSATPIETGGKTINRAVAELAGLNRWVVWKVEHRNGKLTKPPYCIGGRRRASSTDSSTWDSFDLCWTSAFVDRAAHGIGFCLGDGFVGVDLDDCVADGIVAPWALEIVRKLNSYTEISPSGEGLHVIVRAQMNGKGRKVGGAEIYPGGRYFTMTGHHLEGTPDTINVVPAAVLEDMLGEAVDDGDFADGDDPLDALPGDLKGRFNEACAWDDTLDRRWHGEPPGGRDLTRSAWDLSLARLLRRYGGFTLEDFAQLANVWVHGTGADGDQRQRSRAWSKACEEWGEAPHDAPHDAQHDAPRAQVQMWPSPLGEAAFHGLAGDVVRALEPCSEADPASLLLQFLTAFGNAAGRTCYIQIEGDRHPPQLWCVLVGNTSKARKGTSQGRIRQLMTLACPGWASERMSAGLSSGEGILWQVRDPITRRHRDKATGNYEEEEVDAGVDDKRLLVIETEFASPLRHMERPGNTLSSTLRCLWDSGDVRSLTKNSPAATTGATVSVVGHVTLEELKRYLTRTELANGLANRFLFACVRRSKSLPFGGEPVDLEPLAQRIADCLACVDARGEQRILWTDAARTIWTEVYPALSEGKPGMVGAVTSRAEAQTLRLALVYALLDGLVYLEPEHLRAALAVWMYCDQSAACLFGVTLGDPLADEIRRALEIAPQGMTRNDIMNLFGRHKDSASLGRALELLVEHGMVRCEIRATGGRPVQRFFAL